MMNVKEANQRMVRSQKRLASLSKQIYSKKPISWKRQSSFMNQIGESGLSNRTKKH